MLGIVLGIVLCDEETRIRLREERPPATASD